MKLKSKEEILLKKLIDFSSLEMYDSEEIRSGLYKLFFEWSKDLGLKKQEKTAGSMKVEDEDKDDAGSNTDDNEDKMDKEEKKKRKQLRLDQELFEFEERGGFVQVLKDIFNPSD